MNWYNFVKYAARYNIPVNQNNKGQQTPIFPDAQPTLKNNDVVTIYHAFNNYADALQACTLGISGGERVSRRYSYENNNNPRGLFVSLDLAKIKQFASSFYPAVIIEFAAKTSDLESPVWPAGSYTVQGEKEQFFSNDSEQNVKDRDSARLKTREEAMKSDYEPIRNADKPELSQSLLWSGEHQALFTGHLNANMIRAVWVSASRKGEHGIVADWASAWSRLSRVEFLKRMQKEKIKPEDHGKPATNADRRFFKPNDEWNPDIFFQKVYQAFFARRNPKPTLEESKEEILDILSRHADEQELRTYVWPKQMPYLKALLKQYLENGK